MGRSLINSLKILLVPALAMSACGAQKSPSASAKGALILDSIIALPGVKGRIDHLTYDHTGRRLFVAELGNGTVDAIDLSTARQRARIAGLHEPQGLAWLAAENELAVASGDGTLRFYSGGDLALVAMVKLGVDADNVRIDARNGSVVVGYGAGGLAVIDPRSHRVIRRISLPGHPESFRLDGDAFYVNVPDAGMIIAGNIDTGDLTSHWRTGWHRLNFPMVLGPTASGIAVAFRLPPALSCSTLLPDQCVRHFQHVAIRMICSSIQLARRSTWFADRERSKSICAMVRVMCCPPR